MEPKKISFGFNKLFKKTNIISNNIKQDEKKVELIECLEGQSIKVKDAIEETKQLLVIPIKANQKNLLDRIREAKKRERTLEQKKNEPEDNRPDSELSVDELVARQLIREAKDRLTNGNNTNENKIEILPLSNETLSLEGEKEPTLEDYESVPISDYGLALLRGMGWKEGMTVGKNTSKTVSVSVPELRPKGLGLGATKVVQCEIPAKKPVDKDGKELILVKGAFAKVIAGVQKGNYCEIQGFDEEAARVIVKVYPKGEILNINEFMVVPVTKEEFSKGSKILNNAKYEEYREISDKNLQHYKIKEEPLIKKEHSQNSDLHSEEYHKGNTKNKKYSKEFKNMPVSRDERDSRSRQRDGHTRNKHKSESSDGEYETEKTSQKRTKSKYRDRSRSRSASKHKSKKDKNRLQSDSSLEAENYEKEKKSNKHSKSKYHDKSLGASTSRDKYKKDKKSKSKQRRDSSSSESDYNKDKRKKNKCKSRHRRNSSSSSTERKSYRSKR